MPLKIGVNLYYPQCTEEKQLFKLTDADRPYTHMCEVSYMQEGWVGSPTIVYYSIQLIVIENGY